LSKCEDKEKHQKTKTYPKQRYEISALGKAGHSLQFIELYIGKNLNKMPIPEENITQNSPKNLPKTKSRIKKAIFYR
jgi:hypothetical protein